MANAVQVKKVNWWHEAIFEWLIMNPEKKLGAAAKHFKVSQAWLSVIMNSDVFKERYEKRRDEHFAVASRTTIERMQGLTDLSLDILEERIDKERKEIGLGLVKETAEMGLRALGYTGPNNGTSGGKEGTSVTINITPKDLAESRALMDQRKTIDVEAEEVE
jgi:hypothetical protein